MDTGRRRAERPLAPTLLLAVALLASCTSAGKVETSTSDRSSGNSTSSTSTTTSAPASSTTSSPLAPTLPTPLSLSFYGAPPSLTNDGDEDLNLRVVTGGSGDIAIEPGRAPEEGQAARFPTFDAAASAPRAIVEVTNVDGTDHLDPGSGRFEFGTDLTLDATSADLDPASLDDGDNVMQRGRYDDVSQYKLEIDLGQPICRVKGRSGELTVVAGIRLKPDQWYRVQCVRDADRLTVRVATWNPDRSLSRQEWSKTGPTGDVAPAEAAEPLSIGGKLGDNGPATDADQFNGRLDNVYLSIG